MLQGSKQLAWVWMPWSAFPMGFPKGCQGWTFQSSSEIIKLESEIIGNRPKAGPPNFCIFAH